MISSGSTILLNRLLLFSYGLFAIACTFSIALAQLSLGLSMLLFFYLSRNDWNRITDHETKKLYGLIGLFVLWQFITSIASAGFVEGLSDIRSYWLLIALPVGIYLFRSSQNRKIVLQLLAVATIVGALAGIGQFFTGVEWPGVRPPRPNEFFGFRAQGLFSSSMTFAHCFLIPVTLFLSIGINQLRTKNELISSRLALAAGVVGSIAIILSLSRGAIVGLVVALIWITIGLGRKNLIYLLISLVVVASASALIFPDLNRRFVNTIDIDLDSRMYTGRLHVWQKSLEIIVDEPLLGVGRSHFTEEFVSRMDRVVPADRLPGDAHNDWLNILSVSGIPGGILFLLLWVTIAQGLRRKIDQASSDKILTGAVLATMVAVLTLGMFASVFEDAEVFQLIMLVLVFGFAATDGVEPIVNKHEGV